MLDDPISEDPAAAATATAPPPTAIHDGAASFVLFVGAGCRPGDSERAAFARGGTRCLSVPGPEQARSAARLARFDAVVVDADSIGIPFALTLARLIETLACPIIVVAAADAASQSSGEVLDEIMALELGADVYLRRPVLPRLLRAHLCALLRRQPALAPPPAVAPAVAARPAARPAVADAWPPWRATQRLAAGLAAVALNDTQAALLQCLVAAQGRIVTRDELLAALPMGRGLRARSIDVYMHRLRRRLASSGSEWPCIGAVRGRGYILTGARSAAAPQPLRAAA